MVLSVWRVHKHFKIFECSNAHTFVFPHMFADRRGDKKCLFTANLLCKGKKILSFSE